MIFGGIADAIIAVLLFTLGIKCNQKYPNLSNYLAFVWNAVEYVAKWLFSLASKSSTTPPPAAPAAK